MKLLTIGINHKTTPLHLREQLVFAPEKLPLALQDLMQRQAVNEAVILSTCNRTELYTDATDRQWVMNWLAETQQLPLAVLQHHSYYYESQAALRHLLRVAVGLDSMVIGEPQIFGQLKNAFSLAQKVGAVGSQFERVFQTIFAASKQVRTETSIGANPVTLAYAVIHLAKQIYTDITANTALLIGAGEMIELMATHLHAQGVRQIIMANRDGQKAQQLAAKFNAQAITMSDIPVYLHQVDIVVTATASPLPILGKGAVESALKLRKHRPMLMVDLAVPRDIEPEIATLEDVYLNNLDDLQTILQENLQSRHEAAKQAEAVVELQALHCMRELHALKAADTIRAYRKKISHIADKELALALEQLQQGKDPQQLLQTFSQSLVQKIMHTPSAQLRQAAYDGQLELLLLAQRLFEL